MPALPPDRNPTRRATSAYVRSPAIRAAWFAVIAAVVFAIASGQVVGAVIVALGLFPIMMAFYWLLDRLMGGPDAPPGLRRRRGLLLVAVAIAVFLVIGAWTAAAFFAALLAAWFVVLRASSPKG
jgi:hypothetical protein